MPIPLHHINLYKHGTIAYYNGNPYFIDYVTIRGHELFVRLEGLRDTVAPNDISVEVTVIAFNRDNGGPRAWVDSNASPNEPVPIQSPELPDDWVF
jgi:hypothetical protein